MHVCLGSFASILPCPRYVCFSPDSDRTAVSIRCQFDGWRPSLLSGGKSRRIYRIDGRNLTYPSMRRGDRVSSELDARKGSGSMQPNGCTAAAFSAWEIASLKIQQIRQSQPPSLDYFFELMATVRVSFLLGGERFHGRLNRSSVLSDVPAKATRLAGLQGHKAAATEPYPSIAEQLSAPEIPRSPEARCGGPAPMEACEQSLIASPPFLPVLSVSPLSFLPPARSSTRRQRQPRRSDRAPITSGLPRKADKFRARSHFAFVPISDTSFDHRIGEKHTQGV